MIDASRFANRASKLCHRNPMIWVIFNPTGNFKRWKSDEFCGKFINNADFSLQVVVSTTPTLEEYPHFCNV
jgi:hypothetical protein